VFHKLPRLSGWKYETHEGILHVQPDGSVQVVRLDVDREPAATLDIHNDAPHRVVPWQEAGRAALLAFNDTVFSGTVHYWGWEGADRRDDLAEALSRCGDVGSVVAVGGEGLLVGALLTARGAGGPFINVLGVDPDRRRQGIARTMLAAALHDVRGGGYEYLHSSYLVACVQSALWHYAVGFEDIPTPAATASRLRAVRWELARTPAVADSVTSAVHASVQSAMGTMGSEDDALALVTPA